MSRVTFTASVWKRKNNGYSLKKENASLTKKEGERLLSQLENMSVPVEINGEIWDIPLPEVSSSYQRLKRQLQEEESGSREIFREAKAVQKEYDNWKKQRQKIEAEESSYRAREYYQQMKKADQRYREYIGRYMPVFEELKPDLACFAGCTQESCYPELSVSIENRQNHLKYIFLHNKLLFENLKNMQIPACSEILGEAFLDTEEKRDIDDMLPDEVKDFVTLLLNLLSEIEYAGNKCQYVEKLERIWDRKKALQAQRFFEKEKDKALKRPKEESLKEAGLYQAEAEKIRKYIRSREKDFSYVRLLQMAVPIIEEIAEQREERDAGWHKKIAESLYQLLLDYNKESDKIQFCWVAYDDKVCAESESIRVDFIAGEGRWPGLYLYYAKEEKELICITPGSALAV